MKVGIQDQTQQMKDAIQAEQDRKIRARSVFQGIAAILALLIPPIGGFAIGAIGYSVGMGIATATFAIKDANSLKSLMQLVHPQPDYSTDTNKYKNKWFKYFAQRISDGSLNVLSDNQKQLYQDKSLTENEKFKTLQELGATQHGVPFGKVNSKADLLGNLVKKDGKEITIENTIGPNEDVIRITYRRGITAGDILVELDMANDYVLADAERELSLGDVIPPSAELMLISGSIAGSGELNNFFRDKRHKLIDKIINIFELTKNQLSHILYKDGNYHRVNILNDVLINNELLDSNREKLPNVILEFMYNIYMMDFIDHNVQEIFSDLDTFRNKKVEVLLLCREFLKDIGYDPDRVGLTKEEITNDNLFSKLKEIMDKLSENYVSRNVKTIDSRKWYFDNKKEIEKIIEEYFEIPINKY